MDSTTALPLPPQLMRRLRFRAKREHRSLEAELIHCITLGLEAEQGHERFRDRARRLRHSTRGVLRNDVLSQLIDEGRA
ncbi:MAG: FitA-like ribbon-helix-helix domain-containing protein [Puniceicoccales bacterium]